MTKVSSKVLALLLAILMLTSVFPVSVFADTLEMPETQESDSIEEQPEDRGELSTEEEEDSEPLEALEEIQRVNPPAEIMATTPGKVTVAQAQANINTLVSLFKDCYFTTDNKSNKGRDIDYAALPAVATSSWFKNKVGRGTLDYSLMAATRVYNGSSTTSWGTGGYQCFGFANFAHWYIFTSKNTDNIESEAVFSGTTNYNNVSKNAKPGDLLCVYRNDSDMHSMIYISCNSSNITVLDANWANGTGSCIIQKHNIIWSDLSYYTYLCITRAKNYDYSSSDIKVTSVSVNPTSATLTVGDTKTLTATVSPSNATNKAVTWSSTNTGVATVSSSGVVTAKAKGTATIKATTSDGGYTASCTVTVNPITYTVTYNANGGSGGPTSQTKEKGVGLTLSNSVPTLSGYTFKGWQAPSTTQKGDWTTTKPTSGSYETGYKFYTWGCECKNDYTYYVDDIKESAIQWVKDHPDYFGSYSPSLIRYFWIIESTKKGSINKETGKWNYKVGENNNVDVDFIGLDGTVGTASIWKTTFYFESEVYRQDVTVPGKIYQPGDSYTTDANVTLTAVWEKNTAPATYTVSYDANGGTGAPAAQTKTQGTTLKLSSTVPTKENFVFLYWFDDYGMYYPGDNYSADRSTVLRACWGPTWDPTVFIEDVEGMPGERIGIPLCIKDNLKVGEEKFDIYVSATIGKQKVEWNFTENDGELPENDVYFYLMCTIPEDAKEGDEYSVSVSVNSFEVGPYSFYDVNTVNGKIKVTNCTVSYDANGGSGAPAAQTKIIDQTLKLSSTVPTRSGYTFKHWEATDGTTYAPGDSYTKNEATTLKAIWEKSNVETVGTMSISSGTLVKGSTITVSLSLTENTKATVMQFSVLYDKEKLTLESAVPGEAMSGKDPLINTTTPGKVIFVWDGLTPFTSGGSLLDLTFSAKEGAEGQASVTVDENNDFIFAGEGYAPLHLEINAGCIQICDVRYGDVNNDGDVNVIDANLVRRASAKLLTLDDNQSIAADVDGNGTINVIDANIIRRHAAKLITKFPVEE